MAGVFAQRDIVATIQPDGSAGSLRYEVLETHGHAVWVKTPPGDGETRPLFLTKGAHELMLAPAETAGAA